MMSVTDQRQWNFPTRMVFGVGAITRLPKLCAELGMKNPLFVTDEGLKDMAIVSETLALMKQGDVPVAVFSGVKGNPTNGNVEAGLKVYRDGGHDSAVAFGGGSALDAGKAIAFMAGQERPIWDFEDVGSNWRRANIDNVAPVIAVPTTSGTGSEVGRASIISNEETKVKKIIFHPSMMPEIALCDPELTVGLPAHLTAATGFDAFVHCFEAFCAPGYHPMADGIAVEGIRIIHKALPRVVAEPTDIEARGHMLVASSMGATAFQKGLGAIHALSHPFGGIYGAHHGALNGVIMPYVLTANRSAIETQVDYLATVIGVQGFDGFYDWVLSLRSEIGIPNTLEGLDIPQPDYDRIAAVAIEDPTAGCNPIQFTVEQYAELARKAYVGEL